jgi:hypothetical protein
MPVRRLPVRPDPQQIHRQAKELLRAVHAGDSNAIAGWREHNPESTAPSDAKLADAQFVLARTYGASSWTRRCATRVVELRPSTATAGTRHRSGMRSYG